MMRMIPMMPMALITLMMLMMLIMLVMLAMAPMLALGHGCCPHAGMAAVGALAMAGIAKVLQVMQRCAGRRPSDAGALPMRQDVSAGA
jgi:hypothetical protein